MISCLCQMKKLLVADVYIKFFSSGKERLSSHFLINFRDGYGDLDFSFDFNDGSDIVFVPPYHIYYENNIYPMTDGQIQDYIDERTEEELLNSGLHNGYYLVVKYGSIDSALSLAVSKFNEILKDVFFINSNFNSPLFFNNFSGEFYGYHYSFGGNFISQSAFCNN